MMLEKKTKIKQYWAERNKIERGKSKEIYVFCWCGGKN
jgi:hypothetical protein